MMIRSSSPSVHLLVVLNVDVGDTERERLKWNITFQSVSTLEQIRPADRY
jgi:hypothetical protein